MKKAFGILFILMGGMESASSLAMHNCVYDAAKNFDVVRLAQILKDKKHTFCDANHDHASSAFVAALRPCDEDEEEKRYAVIKLLLAHGACVCNQEKDKTYPIIQAARIGAVKEAALFLELCALPVDVQDGTLRTPLMHAAGGTQIQNFYQEVVEVCHPTMVVLLLLYGADHTKETKKGTGKRAANFAPKDSLVQDILQDPRLLNERYSDLVQMVEKLKRQASIDYGVIKMARHGRVVDYLRKRELGLIR